MVTDEQDRIEAGVQFLYHGERMTAPAADDPRAFRQPRGDDVAAAAMRILDQYLARPGGHRALAGGHRLARHLLAELGIVRVSLASFVPVGDSGRAFDVHADIDFHTYRPNAGRHPLVRAAAPRLLQDRAAAENLGLRESSRR